MSFFQKIQSSLEVQRAKEKFSDNPGHNILEYCNILVQIQVTTNKTVKKVVFKTLQKKWERHIKHEDTKKYKRKVFFDSISFAQGTKIV